MIRPRLWMVALVLPGLVLAACEERAPEEPTDTSPLEELTREGREFGDALQRSGDQVAGELEQFVDSGRDTLVSEAERRLENLAGEVEQLEQRAEAAEAELGQRWPEIEREINDALDNARQTLREVRQAGSEGWRSAAGELGEAMHQLRQGVDEAERYLNRQAEPS